MKRRKLFLLLMMLVGWISLGIQLVLHMQGSTVSYGEALMRFFSFFTIQVNLLVAVFSTVRFFNSRSNPTDYFASPSVQTAVTLYIVVVGLVYNIILRKLWDSTGTQAVIHDMLHSVTPLLMLVYWWFWVDTRKLHLSNIPAWLIYPAVYAVFLLIRGYFANWYAYPFMDITALGLARVLMNSGILVLVFLFFSIVFVYVGRYKKNYSTT